MAIRQYNITFKDQKERTVAITIVNPNTLGSTYTLIPADNPLTISEDDDHNPMKPIRSTVAQIRVACTHEELIPISNSLQWQVTIKRDSATIWMGYLRAEMPDADFSPISDEIYYTADDMLGVMKAQRKSLTGTKTIMGLLLAKNYGWIDNSMPIVSRGMLPSSTLQRLSVQSINWIEQEENSEGNLASVQPATDIVEQDILQWLGMTARYYMGSYYLGTIFGTLFYHQSQKTDIPVIDGAGMEWTGMHSIKMEQGVGHVRVEAVGKVVENVDAPSISDKIFDVVNIGWMAPQTTQGQRNCYFRQLQARQNGGIEVHAYNTGNPGNVLGKKGAHILDIDAWEAQVGEDKRNFNFSRVICLVGVGLNKNGTSDSMPEFMASDTTSSTDVYNRAMAAMMAGLTQPVVGIKYRAPINVKDGGFTLKIEAKSMSLDTIQLAGNSYRQLYGMGGSNDIANMTIFAVCSLRFGALYWTGGTWSSSSSSKFRYSLGILEKTLNMMFDGETAAMPIDGLRSGEVELIIYGVYDIYQSQEETPGGEIVYKCEIKPEPITMIPSVELKYNAPLDLMEPYRDDSIVLNQYTEGLPEDSSEDVSLHLCSRGNVPNNWGFVYDNNDVVSTLHWPKLREDWAPERLLLKKYELAMSRMRSYATLSIECEYTDMPFRRVSLGGRMWYPLAITTDMQTCRSKVLLMDITDIMAELPAIGTDEESSGGEYTVVVTASGDYITLTLAETLAVNVNIVWSTDTESGTATITAGQTSTTFDCGMPVQDERDIGFSASTSTGDTFNFVYQL